VFTVWECALKGKIAKPTGAVAKALRTWLESSRNRGEIAGALISLKLRNYESRS
jgi:G:T-mismatch repair DNA endonuclease (very short patch repair protein)